MEEWGLVLSGGGAKGAYQLGVLKALKEYKGFNMGKIMIDKKLDVKRDENVRTFEYY